jgi:hypothetical protein
VWLALMMRGRGLAGLAAHPGSRAGTTRPATA